MAKKKKTVKKAAAPKKKAVKTKKASKPKTTVHVTIKRKVLGKAPQEYSFHLTDGRKLQSVYELVDELETMGEDVFKHYVNQAENHFANWVEHVFDEKTLAEQMRKIENRLETQRAMLKHLVKKLLEERKEQKAK